MTTTSPGAGGGRGIPPAPALPATKTRLKLTAGVQRGEVVWYLNSGDSHWNGTGGGLLVTSRMAELLAAGWVELGPALDGGAARQWLLTSVAPAVTA